MKIIRITKVPKKNCLLLIFVILLVCLSGLSFSQSITISGVVRDENGVFVSDAIVKAWPTSLSATTDIDGLFKLSNVEADTSIYLYGIKNGYFTGCSRVPDGQDSLSVDLMITSIPNHLEKVSPYLFGSNYWKPYHPDLNYFKGQISEAAINTVRLGGHSFDGAGRTWDEQAIDSLLTFCRSIDATPIVQAQLFGGSAQKSADMVDYANIQKGYGIGIWSVGNEPDIYELQGQGPYDLLDYSRDFREYYHAMKSIDPGILIAGPELAWNYDIHDDNNWLTRFLEACGDIVDIITFHRYPFFGIQTIEETLLDPPLIETLIDEIRSEVLRITGRQIPIALTETNLNWQWTGTGDGYGDSFYAGLWWGETLGRLIKKGLLMANFWTLVDDGPLSMFAADDGIYAPRRPRPTYYVHYLFHGFFQKYLSSQSNNAELVAFVSQDSSGGMIMISINKSQVQNFKTRFAFSDQVLDQTREICLNLPKLSMTRVNIEPSGNISSIKLYSIREFESNIPPIDADSIDLGFTNDIDVVVNIPADYVTSVEENPGSKSPPTSYFVSDSYPNPSNGRTILDFEIVHKSPASRVEISIFDLNGRLIRTLVNGTWSAARHAVEWDGLDNSKRAVPNGIYFFSVRIDDRFVGARKTIRMR